MPRPADPRSSPQRPAPSGPLPPLLRELWRVSHAALAEAGALAFPVPCVGCGEPPAMLCARCRVELRPAVCLRVLEPGLHVWSGLPFAGVPARAIRALKSESRTPLARALAPALGEALDAAWHAAVTPDAAGPLLVPIPTSAASWRRRGVRVVELVMRRAGAPRARMLRHARRVADQRALGRAERGRNVAGSMRCDELSGASVLLVDDVVTTGATLVEASRAVVAAGGRVLGAVTVASTPRVFEPTPIRA
ncbi:MAG: ComF family protein [Microbacteriaceae bacterium]|nr:ComF family protein [Microbacteriaceae bacterium]